MELCEIKSNAKINLSLNITGVRSNLHTLDMIVVSVDLADTIVISKRNDKKVVIKYWNEKCRVPFLVSTATNEIDFKRPVGDAESGISIKNCSVTKSINQFKNKFGFGGINVEVIKKIPISAGLGGSGVDAAGALRGLAQMSGIDVDCKELKEVASLVGSDVPYLLKGGLARVRGVGDEVEFFNNSTHKADFNIVIAKSDGGVLSKDAYRVFDKIYPSKSFSPSDNDKLLNYLKIGEDSFSALEYMGNALTKASIKLDCGITKTLEMLKLAGAVKTLMTGSGSACVGFFNSEDMAKLATDKLQKQNHFVYSCRVFL